MTAPVAIGAQAPEQAAQPIGSRDQLQQLIHRFRADRWHCCLGTGGGVRQPVAHCRAVGSSLHQYSRAEPRRDHLRRGRADRPAGPGTGVAVGGPWPGGPRSATGPDLRHGHEYLAGRKEWPLARTQWASYFLASGGSANTRDGDGELRRGQAPAGDEPPDTIEYDPADPVPFISDFASSSQIGGPDDNSAVEDRRDVLVYTTPPLEGDLEVTGPVRLKLHAASSAVDTDFTAKLLDVHPSGFSQRLCDGMIRARFRNGYLQDEVRLVPGEIVQYEEGYSKPYAGALPSACCRRSQTCLIILTGSFE